MPWPVAVGGQPGAEVTVAIRPEALMVVKSVAASGIAICGTIRHVEMLGAETLVHVIASPLIRPLVTRVEPSVGAALRIGEPITLSTDPRRVLVFGKDGRRIADRLASAGTPQAVRGEAVHV